MNKKQIVASLNKIANELDNSGLYSEASTVTKVMSRVAADDDYSKAYFEKYPDAPRTYEKAYFKQNPDAPRSRGADYSFEPKFRNEGMAISDLMDPEGTSNRFDVEYSRHNDITTALDELEKAIRDSESMTDASKDKAREHIQNIKRLSNEILENGF